MGHKTQLINPTVAYHRNGICGLPFFVVIFDWDGGDRVHRMVAIVPEHPIARSEYVVSVLDVDLLSEGEIGFGVNSWRGDDFADAIFAEIDKSKGVM